jgi:RNA polymerase sigma factor (TIGR02999 family)
MDPHSGSEPAPPHAPGSPPPEAGAPTPVADAVRESVTALLADLSIGHTAAADALFPLVYDELRRIAHRQLQAERPGHTLATTGLVHEAYLRLVDQTRARWVNRAQFLAVASRVMRRILVDYARHVRADKRGGRWERLDLDDVQIPVRERADELVALDDALQRLTALSPRLARVVECRFFGGMTEEETALALGVTDRTVRRDWVKAKGWLSLELAERPA